MTDKKKKRIPCMQFSRIVGYISPLHLWNDGKRQEFKDRQTYKIDLERRKAIENAE